jgi:hypothetical protein
MSAAEQALRTCDRRDHSGSRHRDRLLGALHRVCARVGAPQRGAVAITSENYATRVPERFFPAMAAAATERMLPLAAIER